MKIALFILFVSCIISASGQIPVSTWGTNVNVRSCASTSCAVVGQIKSPTTVSASCQQEGETVTASGYTNNFWSKLSSPNGYMSNIFIKGAAIIAGVPLCGQNPVPVSTWGTNVNVRSCGKRSCQSFGKIAGPTTVNAICQDQGETVTASGYTNSYWMNIMKSGGAPGGWMSNIYIKGGKLIAGVPLCRGSSAGASGSAQGGSTSLTEADLEEMMPNADSSTLQGYFPYLDAAMAEGQINTCPRMSAFLAQLAQESGELKYMEELASGEEYEGRCSDLGNCSPGDGRKYKGRGPIQLTGKSNYERAGADLGLDLVNNPELAAQPENAFRIAVWFWNGRSLNDYADQNTQDSFNQITLKINGCITCSSTHNDVRTNYWNQNKAILGC